MALFPVRHVEDDGKPWLKRRAARDGTDRRRTRTTGIVAFGQQDCVKVCASRSAVAAAPKAVPRSARIAKDRATPCFWRDDRARGSASSAPCYPLVRGERECSSGFS